MARTKDNKPQTRTAKGVAAQAVAAAPDEVERSQTDGKQSRTERSGAQPTWFGRMLFHGWVNIAVWMVFGLLLEGLLGYKTPAYLNDDQRRELFRLAHTHGTFLGLVLIAAALCGRRMSAPPPRAARVSLRVGTLLMPLGFLLAGMWHYESDPGIAIWLVPPAALMVIFGAVAFALASRSDTHDS